MNRNPAGLLALAFVISVAAACAKESNDTGVLQRDDLSPVGGGFDPNSIVDKDAFEDSRGIELDALQKFLGKTPYARPSFLETYQSNGIRAADAIIRAAGQYRLNPLVFLVRAQIDQGLVGEQFYPFPTDRVEYVFRCGCYAGHCDPAYAGFDKQVDCLGRELRRSLDDVEANGHTAGGWGPDSAQTTLDGQKVQPADAATAVLYQYTPIVGKDKAGNWLFWNLWYKYAKALDYAGPVEGQSPKWIGDDCKGADGCPYEGGICVTTYPGGLCSYACTGECPALAGRPTAFCAEFPNGGYCLELCNPNAPACRQGYECKPVKKFGGPQQATVCTAVQGGQ
jgi:hypothetical protein